MRPVREHDWLSLPPPPLFSSYNAYTHTRSTSEHNRDLVVAHERARALYRLQRNNAAGADDTVKLFLFHIPPKSLVTVICREREKKRERERESEKKKREKQKSETLKRNKVL